VPDSSSQSAPPCWRGECGIEKPSATMRSLVTSITTPPSVRRSRQPSTMSVVEQAVT
jgi:hypothetical protein